MDKYLTCTDAEYAKYAKQDTNRQLLKNYRQALDRKADVEGCIARQPGKSSPSYLGYPAYRVLRDTKRSIAATEKELIARGYILAKIKL